jgi:hypothetical protein
LGDTIHRTRSIRGGTLVQREEVEVDGDAGKLALSLTDALIEIVAYIVRSGSKKEWSCKEV